MSLIIIEAETEVAEIIPVMTVAMIEAEAITQKGLTIEIEENIFLVEANPEVIIIPEDHTEDEIITEIDVTADKQGSEVNLDALVGVLELHQGLPADIMTDVLV